MSLAIIAAALFLSAACRGQEQSAASDNQLYAGYCLGVMTEMIDQTNSNPPATAPQFAQLRQRAIEDLRSRQRRFASYLLATNSIQTDQAGGTIIAMARGKSEATICTNQTRQCLVPDASKREPWYAAHYMNSGTCSTLNRCFDRDNLPF
jgi:hypothetical protein